MINENDSNTSACLSLSEQERKRKKFKMKSEKKYKKEKKKKSHKEGKRSHKDKRKTASEEDDIKTKKSQTKCEVKDVFGPALPPHLLNKSRKSGENESSVIGPIIPKELLGNLKKPEPEKLSEKNIVKESHSYTKTESENDNFQCYYGPLPVSNELEMTSAQLELEQRALELKIAAMDGVNTLTNIQNVREEWMLELPDVGLKGGLAALNNLKRTFHQGKEKPDFSDRSSWTKTPNSCQKQERPISSQEELETRAQALQEKQRDAEQEAIAKEHKKKHKRKESLVEIHQKKIRIEEKKKLKELKRNGAKPERRPFTRDIDLKLNKIDRNQTKQIVDKAKILNSKFSSGQSKYL